MVPPSYSERLSPGMSSSDLTSRLLGLPRAVTKGVVSGGVIGGGVGEMIGVDGAVTTGVQLSTGVGGV
jgi:hypothetical protein